jgi:cytochrome P450
VLSRDRDLRSIVEKEADVCLSSDGDIDIRRIHRASITKGLVLEVMRLAPARSLIVFEANSGFSLRSYPIKHGDRIIICPHIIYRGSQHFPEANEMRIGRKYDKELSGLQYLACGGRIVFRLVFLNLVLLLLDLAAAFELELAQGPDEFRATPRFGAVRPDVKVRLNLRRSRLFR